MAVMDPVGESKYVRAELRTIVFNHGGFVRGQWAGAWASDSCRALPRDFALLFSQACSQKFCPLNDSMCLGAQTQPAPGLRHCLRSSPRAREPVREPSAAYWPRP